MSELNIFYLIIVGVLVLSGFLTWWLPPVPMTRFPPMVRVPNDTNNTIDQLFAQEIDPDKMYMVKLNKRLPDDVCIRLVSQFKELMGKGRIIILEDCFDSIVVKSDQDD